MLDLRLRFVNSGRRQPSEMVRARCQKATADSTLCGIVPTNARMLPVRTRRPLGHIPPCLPSHAERPPSGPEWLHEIKHDGFRIMARRDNSGVRLYTRNGYDFAGRFPQIVEAEERIFEILKLAVTSRSFGVG